jgi:hypothetical protein
MTNGARSEGPKAATAALSSADEPSPPEDSQGEEDELKKESSDGEDDDVDKVADSFGFLRVDADKSFYYGSNHWVTIINDVSVPRYRPVAYQARKLTVRPSVRYPKMISFRK